MSEPIDSPPQQPVQFRSNRRRLERGLRAIVLLAGLYVIVAYVAVPTAWQHVERKHPALDQAPTITHTKIGIPGDPLNIALVGTEEQVTKAMLAADWNPADPLTLKSSLRIAGDTVLHRPYNDAPVSNLYVWNRKEDLAFELPIGNDPRRRNHVRFWKSDKLDDQGRPLWLGAATLDTKVGFSHTTGEITHHISPDVDTERDKLLDDLQKAGAIASVDYVDNFQPKLDGHNGGGDPYHTDGRLAVGTLAGSMPSNSATAQPK
ncbi:MAG TPA: LssY C-terminal domain-containing protein [Pirellulales bacterium]|nr:LssY C-terminal domain-containing protein [Pirellulales bacterium]